MQFFSEKTQSPTTGFTAPSMTETMVREEAAAARAVENVERFKGLRNFGRTTGRLAMRGGAASIEGLRTAGGGLRKFMGKGVKTAGWAAAITAGVAALGMWASSSRKAAQARAREDAANANMSQGDDLPDVMTPQMMATAAAQPQQPEMAAGPADGRAPNEWVNRVAAERGTPQQGQAQKAAVNPQMNVVPESSVQDLSPPAQTR